MSQERLRSLAPDLVYRLDTDREETGRIPALFTLKWRYQESWYIILSNSKDATVLRGYFQESVCHYSIFRM